MMFARKNSYIKSSNNSELVHVDDCGDDCGGKKKLRVKDHRRSKIVILSLGIISMISVLEKFCKYMISLETVHGENSLVVDVIPGYSIEKRRNRKVVLLGPHDRCDDVGDMLSERIVSKLLVDRAGYIYNETNDVNNTILLGGLVTRQNMDRYGLTPKKTVYSMKQIQNRSRSDVKYGPYDIVYMGSSGTLDVYERYKTAGQKFGTKRLRESAKSSSVCDCSYLFPKQMLSPIVDKNMASNIRKHKTGETITNLPRPKTNFAIGPSLPNPNANPPLSCRQSLATADHIWFRDNDPIAPDNTFLVRQLYGNQTEEIYHTKVEEQLLEFRRQDTNRNAGSDPFQDLNYIAVQLGSPGMKDDRFDSFVSDLALGLDEVSRELSMQIGNNITIVFFHSGSVSSNDGIWMTQQVIQKMNRPRILYHRVHALSIVALVSHAQAVISTSRTVRILSMVYEKPRLTLALPSAPASHRQVGTFLRNWEAKDVATLGIITDAKKLWDQGLERFFLDENDDRQITPVQTRAACQRARNMYLEHFDQWSTLLTTPVEDEDHYNM